jgi:hypothetical protein
MKAVVLGGLILTAEAGVNRRGLELAVYQFELEIRSGNDCCLAGDEQRFAAQNHTALCAIRRGGEQQRFTARA